MARSVSRSCARGVSRSAGLGEPLTDPGILITSDEESSYFPHRNSYGVVGVVTTRGKVTAALIEYGYGDFANTIHLDNIPADEPTAVRTAILPRTKPGRLQWRFVVTDSRGEYTGATQHITVHPGARLAELIYSSPVLAGNTYYIDPSATVNGTGTEASPFNTWTSILNLGGNHTYLQKRGTTYQAGTSLRGINGVCKIGAYGDETLPRPRIVASGSVVRFIDTSYRIIVENLDIEGTTKDANQMFSGIGFRIRNGAGTVIYNTVVHGFSQSITGNPINGTNGNFWAGIRLLGVEVYDCATDGIYMDDVTDIYMSHIYVHDVNQMYSVNQDENISNGDGVQIAFTQLEATNRSLSVEIHNSTIDRRSHGNKFCLISGAGGSGAVSRNAKLLANANEFFMHSAAGGVYIDTSNDISIFTGNLFEGGTFGIHNRAMPGIYVYGNIFRQTGTGISNMTGNMYLHNNTFDDFNYAFSIVAGYTYSSVNNCFGSSRSGAAAIAGSAFSTVVANYNHYDVAPTQAHATLAAWQAANGQDANSATGSPLFTSPSDRDYTPQALSPLVNSGSNLSWAEYDMAGNYFSSSGAIDKGAVERGGSQNYENEWYGIEYDETALSTSRTRIGKASLHATLPVQSARRRCIINSAGVVQYYTGESNSTRKIDGTAALLDGTDGQWHVELPAHYFRVELEGSVVRKKISKYPIDGFTYSPKMYLGVTKGVIKRSTNQLMSVINTTPDFRGGNNNAAWDAQPNTLLGKPATAISETNFRLYARNNGPKWCANSFAARSVDKRLYEIEYANSNIQLPYNEALTAEGYRQGGLGAGVTGVNSTNWNTFNGYYPLVPCGVTAVLGNKSGVVNYTITGFPGGDITVQVPSYRGLESPYGDIWEWEDGILYNIQSNDSGGQSQVFICDDPANYADVLTNYRLVGTLPRNEGYVSKCLHDEGLSVPYEATGGSSTTRYADYFYTSIPASGSSIRGSLVSATATTGAHAGLFYLNTLNAPSNTTAHFGSRPCFIP